VSSKPPGPQRIIPQKALNAQAQSSDPQASVWVSANAGSGKTHVLTERVIRLLLEGTEPARILCLTYTKAAAAVMQKRIFDRLAAWTRMDDRQLAEALRALEGRTAGKKRLQAARRLFAQALETPGGLKIQTIHAFCEALLHQFPLEANIAGHFDMMDDMQQTSLLREARRQLFETAYQAPGTDLGRAFALVLATAGESGLHLLLEEAIQNRQLLSQCIRKGQDNGLEQLLRDMFGLEPHDTAPSLTAALKETALLPAATCALLAKHGGTRAADFVAQMQQLLAADTGEVIRQLCLSAYFREDKHHEPRKPGPVFTKAVQAAAPDAIEQFLEKQQALADLFEKLNAIELVSLNKAAYTVIEKLLGDYSARKRAHGLLDFDDLIYRALALLRRKGGGQWVQYKLDRGIDHILVDEAQDTSPAQWDIVRLLSDEFFAGRGQREINRTVFAVGDEKQSIYSFQGAVPEDFDNNSHYISRRAAQARRTFRKVRLDFSFRSTRDVLSAVDRVFATQENYEGLTAENQPTVHDAIRVHEPGAVDIWHMLTPQDIQEPEDWRQPVDYLASPAIRLAGQIAETIDTWLKNGEPLRGQGRPMRASDIMVLVRNRGQFVHALSRALKNRGVAVAGADRLRLSDHIAVRDLMALGAFVLQPHDDLSLAAVLKSPLFSLEEEQLLALAANRSGTLWAALEHAAQHCGALASMVEELRTYRAAADITPVFEFYSRVLSQNGGRRKILARLGAEAGDVLDAFLDYSLAVQKTGLPGLQAFLETLRVVNPEIKRELDQNRDEVRIMTVHAAKGLEAGVVFLVDAGSRIWNSRHEPKLLPVRHHETAMLLWQPSAALKTKHGQAVIDRLKQRAEQEYRRLLYVGMTRAEDRLIVCGYRGKQQAEGTWLALVAAALQPYAETIPPPAEGVAAWRYRVNPQDEMALACQPAAPAPQSLPAVPGFLWQKAAPERSLPRPLAPSGPALAIETEPAIDPERMSRSPVLADIGGPGQSVSFAIERGNAMHRLLQYLPDVAAEKRQALASHYLQRRLPGCSAAQHQDMLKSVFTILEDARFSDLFSETGKAEVAVMGVIDVGGSQRAVAGQIDRLAVYEQQVLLADFKTGQPARSSDDIPVAYLLQLALYVKLLEPLYPGRDIRPALIYTQTPVLFTPDREKLNELIDKLRRNAVQS